MHVLSAVHLKKISQKSWHVLYMSIYFYWMFCLSYQICICSMVLPDNNSLKFISKHICLLPIHKFQPFHTTVMGICFFLSYPFKKLEIYEKYIYF